MMMKCCNLSLVFQYSSSQGVAVSCGYGTCFAVKTCNGLCHFIFSIDRVGTLWIINDHMDLCQTPCVQVPEFFRHWGHVVSLDQLPTKIGSFNSYLRVYMGCDLAVVFQVRSLYIP